MRMLICLVASLAALAPAADEASPVKDEVIVAAAVDAALLASLREAPRSVTVAGQTCTLDAYAWRDFMPGVEPDRFGLMVTVVARPGDGSAWLDSMAIDRIWVVHGDDVWEAPVGDEQRPEPANAIARGGPRWAPGDRVTVVARITAADGASALVRAAEATIDRTE
ncbi:MAG TPA: hypothetical protein VEL07_20905 [Planctomycetota bacterium]|nr:hypothetical protein [Planctomycetota bacterium]